MSITPPDIAQVTSEAHYVSRSIGYIDNFLLQSCTVLSRQTDKCAMSKKTKSIIIWSTARPLQAECVVAIETAVTT